MMSWHFHYVLLWRSAKNPAYVEMVRARVENKIEKSTILKSRAGLYRAQREHEQVYFPL